MAYHGPIEPGPREFRLDDADWRVSDISTEGVTIALSADQNTRVLVTERYFRESAVQIDRRAQEPRANTPAPGTRRSSFKVNTEVLLNMLLPSLRHQIRLVGFNACRDLGGVDRVEFFIDHSIEDFPDGEVVLTMRTADTIGGGSASFFEKAESIGAPASDLKLAFTHDKTQAARLAKRIAMTDGGRCSSCNALADTSGYLEHAPDCAIFAWDEPVALHCEHRFARVNVEKKIAECAACLEPIPGLGVRIEGDVANFVAGGVVVPRFEAILGDEAIAAASVTGEHKTSIEVGAVVANSASEAIAGVHHAIAVHRKEQR